MAGRFLSGGYCLLGRYFELVDVYGNHIRFALLQLKSHAVIIFYFFFQAGNMHKGFFACIIMADETEAFELVEKLNRSGEQFLVWHKIYIMWFI